MSIKSFLQGTFFDVFYRVATPPWVIEQAQPDLVTLEAEGGLRGKSVLDVGCGTGDNAIHLARRGYEVTGIDASRAAIKTAQERAREASVNVAFQVFDAFSLSGLGRSFETVIDYGLFHQFSGKQLKQYVSSLASALEPESQLIVQCFSDQGEPSRGPGPRLVSQEDLLDAFASGWKIDWIRPAKYYVKSGEPYPAWLTSITRLEADSRRSAADGNHAPGA